MLLYEPEPTTSQKSMGKLESSMEALRPSGCLRHLELCKDVAIRAGTHHFAEVDGRFGRWAFRSMGASLGSRAWRAAGSVDDRAAVLQHGLAVLLGSVRSEEHTSELQSRGHLVCRLLLEKKKGT